MTGPLQCERGDRVILRVNGEQFDSRVAIASACGRSLMLSFEAIIYGDHLGHVGFMPLLWEEAEACYSSIVDGTRAEVRKWQ